MHTKETAENIKAIIEEKYKQYGCKTIEVSAVYQNMNGVESQITERRFVRPALVNVKNDGTAIILINSEEPYLGESFFKLLDEVKKGLRENEYSITKAGYLYDFFVVELTYKS